MYTTWNYQIHDNKKYHALFQWCTENGRLATNLYNAALFRERNSMSSRRKEKDGLSLHPLEQEVLDEIERALPDYKRSDSGFIPYARLDELLKKTSNPDYRSGLPIHVAQYVLKDVTGSIKSFFEAKKKYAEDPSLFTGEPQLPRYRRKKSVSGFTASNQLCVIRQNKKGNFYLRFPKTSAVLNLGRKLPDGVLKEVHFTPHNNIFEIGLVFDDGEEMPALPEPSRIAAVDIGVANIMAVVNNCGLPSLLYKGGKAKSINHWYNKEIARMQSAQTKHTGQKYVPSTEYNNVVNWRNNSIRDLFRKMAFNFVKWCVENRIDTVVVGENKGWKQEVDMGDRENQNFVQLPFDKLKRYIEHNCAKKGIRVSFPEESYTSKASFTDEDDIPVYVKGDSTRYMFSGVRGEGRYRWKYRSKKTGLIIHSDLNGAANILRKHYPDAFKNGEAPRFGDITAIKI